VVRCGDSNKLLLVVKIKNLNNMCLDEREDTKVTLECYFREFLKPVECMAILMDSESSIDFKYFKTK
jgi:hypothetical protein